MAAIHGIIDITTEGSSDIKSPVVFKRDKWTVIADASFYKISGSHEEAIEILLNTWLKKGVDCVKELYGDFAFVIHNSETGEIFCARDHFGVRPFFYCFNKSKFIFGSLLKSVVTLLEFKPQIRHDYLLSSLVTAKEPKDLTPFENIYRLKPGHYLHYKNNICNIQPYWQLSPAKQIILKGEKEYIELLREKLLNAVTMRIRGVDRLGSELSGGLDSSAVTGIAAASYMDKGTKIHAYSNVFPQATDMEFKDEREFIGEMVQHADISVKYIDYLSRPIPDLMSYVVGLQACYIQQNFSIFCDALYQSAGKDKVQVLLSGFGGDEMVSARTSVQWNELISDRQWKILREEIFSKGITTRSLAKAIILPIRYLQSLLKKHGFTSGVFTKELLDKRFSNLPLQPEFANKYSLRKRLGDQYIREMRNDLAMRQVDKIMHPHLPQRMEYCYAAVAQYGIEYRYPLLDVDLVETYLAFPSWMKQYGGINRYAFRQAIKGFVPEAIRQRDDKSGSTIPQTIYSFVKEGDIILDFIKEAYESNFLNEIFDFSKFPEWYEKLAKREPVDMNYMMPGAFYTYLMMLFYYLDEC